MLWIREIQVESPSHEEGYVGPYLNHFSYRETFKRASVSFSLFINFEFWRCLPFIIQNSLSLLKMVYLVTGQVPRAKVMTGMKLGYIGFFQNSQDKRLSAQ